MPDVRITTSTHDGIAVTDAHRTISLLGGRGWVWPTGEVIRTLLAGTNTFFTIVEGRRAAVQVCTDSRGQFVRACRNGIPCDDLLKLDACPAV